MTATTQYSRNLFGAAEAHMLAAASANQLVQDQLRALDYEIRAAALKGNTQCEILSGLDSSTIKILKRLGYRIKCKHGTTLIRR